MSCLNDAIERWNEELRVIKASPIPDRGRICQIHVCIGIAIEVMQRLRRVANGKTLSDVDEQKLIADIETGAATASIAAMSIAASVAAI